MQIELGKFYKTRDGRKVGPADRRNRHGQKTGFDGPWRCGSWNYDDNGKLSNIGPSSLDLIAEWTDTPTIWADMTPDEKGALLLAEFEGKPIEMFADGPWQVCTPAWRDDRAYRKKPEPKRETVAMTGHDRGYWCFGSDRVEDRDTHRITFYTIDGEPDCSTIRMERLK